MKQTLVAVLSLLLSVAIVAALGVTGLIEKLELRNYDFVMTVVRGQRPPPENLALVAIDDASIDLFQKQGFNLPWPRSVHAELVGALASAGARMVVFDVVFDQETAEDAYFAQVISETRIPVVLAASIEYVQENLYNVRRELLPAQKLLDAGAVFGFAEVRPDADSVLRHGRLSVAGEPTLSVRAYETLEGPLDTARLPVVRYADQSDPEILINYVGPGRTIDTKSYYQALDYEASLPAGYFKDKIVFVGRSEKLQDLGRSGQSDMFLSPYDVRAADMPGAEVHANLLNTLLTKAYLHQVGRGWMLLLAILLAAGVIVILLRVAKLAHKLLLSGALLLGFVLAAWLALAYGNVWMYTVQPFLISFLTLVTTFFYQYRGLERERAKIRGALEGYVSAPVMNQVLNNPGMLELGGEQVEATVLFSDIAGFSRIAERMTPKELSALLNDYFTRIGDAIMEREGMINKYIGDAVMAVWGVPLRNEKHALMACRTALAMKRVVDELPGLESRIGLNSGPMVAGNLGHRRRMEYTVIGDSVNLASRLEGVNKIFGSSIMISEFTEELVRGRFVVRQLDVLKVVGKAQPVRVFELLAEAGEELPARLTRMLASFNKIMQAYDSRDWELACELIDEHIAEFPEDLPVKKAYAQRCRLFLSQPPPKSWDGVFQMESK